MIWYLKKLKVYVIIIKTLIRKHYYIYVYIPFQKCFDSRIERKKSWYKKGHNQKMFSLNFTNKHKYLWGLMYRNISQLHKHNIIHFYYVFVSILFLSNRRKYKWEKISFLSQEYLYCYCFTIYICRPVSHLPEPIYSSH